ncbi:MAG: SnoaL-like domain-containing protein [Phycisphaerales bacterium]
MAKKPAQDSAAKKTTKKATAKSKPKAAASAAPKKPKKAATAAKPAKSSKPKTGPKSGAKAKSGKKKAAAQPTKVSSGKGATPGELGAKLVAMVNAHTPEKDIWKDFFHKNFESIEGHGSMWTGTKSVAKKGEEWMAAHQVHGFKAEGPFVGATGFAVRYDMDVEVKATGQCMNFSEVGVYTVKNGKVVREEFMYAGM